VLPEYLVPTVLVVLDELPLTANGKLDRAALPDPDGGRQSLGVAYVGPGTAREAVLAEVWSEVLAVPAGAVGVNDNFFELGGDSLRTARVVAHLRERGWSLALRELFLQPTIAALAPMLVPTETAAEPASDEASFDMLSAEDQAALAAMLGGVGEEAHRG
jgi:aryl carrier-like protein